MFFLLDITSVLLELEVIIDTLVEQQAHQSKYFGRLSSDVLCHHTLDSELPTHLFFP